jgi:hypothetical protein
MREINVFHLRGDNPCGDVAFYYSGPIHGDEVIQSCYATEVNGNQPRPGEPMRCGSWGAIVSAADLLVKTTVEHHYIDLYNTALCLTALAHGFEWRHLHRSRHFRWPRLRLNRWVGAVFHRNPELQLDLLGRPWRYEVELGRHGRVLPRHLPPLRLFHHVVAHIDEDGRQVVAGCGDVLQECSRVSRIAPLAVERDVARLRRIAD